MLNVIKHIICELTGYRPGAVDVSQGDRQSRAVSCRLLENGTPWMIPEGATARVAYTLPDGTEGLYDSRADGTPMWEIAGNIVTVELADQLMAQAGMAQVSILVMGPDGGQLAAWPIRVNVVASKATRLTVPENLPPFGEGFAGRIFFGGADGSVTPLAVGDGVEIVRLDDGTYALNAAGGVGEETDPTVPAWAKQAQKPSYTAQEVGAMPAGTKIPGKTSELTNDAGFVDKAVSDLVNYYTKAQMQELIAAIPRFRVTVVQQLPAAGESLVLYLVPFATAEGQYLEYIWVDGRWEVIGSQQVDLSGYATEMWVKEYVAENAAQDITWAALKGKPTYVQTGPRVVEWNGAMDGDRFEIDEPDTTVTTWLKISDEIPSREELIGAAFDTNSDRLWPGPISAIEDGVGCYGSKDHGILVVTQAGEIENPYGRDGIAPSTGIYVPMWAYKEQASPYLRLSYGEYSQEKFDPAWLPDGGFGWEGPGGKIDILPETELVMDENTQTMPMPDGRTLYGYLFHPMALALVDGQEYQITIDGVAYRRNCVLSDHYDNPMYYLGNLALPGVGEDTGEDWVFFVQEADPDYWVGMFATTNTEYKTVAISGQGTVVHQILDKFIPASIARKADIPDGGGINIPGGAEVGQIIVVKAVDDTGKPTEWEAVDMPDGGQNVTDAVRYTPQELTEEQKAQARENTGSASLEAFDSITTKEVVRTPLSIFSGVTTETDKFIVGGEVAGGNVLDGTYYQKNNSTKLHIPPIDFELYGAVLLRVNSYQVKNTNVANHNLWVSQYDANGAQVVREMLRVYPLDKNGNASTTVSTTKLEELETIYIYGAQVSIAPKQGGRYAVIHNFTVGNIADVELLDTTVATETERYIIDRKALPEAIDETIAEDAPLIATVTGNIPELTTDFSAFVVSDMHGSFVSLDDAKKRRDALAKNSPILNLGDMLNGRPITDGVLDSKIGEYMYLARNCAVYHCIGQHEVGFHDSETGRTKNNTLSHAEVFQKFIEPMKSVWGLPNLTTNYYYKDFNKTRLISLYQYNIPLIDDPSNSALYKYNRATLWWGQEQIDWLITTLNSVPDGYRAIVMMHQLEFKIQNANDGSAFYDHDVGGQNRIIDGTPIADIVQAYIDKTTINKSYTCTDKTKFPVEDFTLTVNADFTAATGEFANYLTGDTHSDCVGYAGSTEQRHIGLTSSNQSYDCVVDPTALGANRRIISLLGYYYDRGYAKLGRLGQQYATTGQVRILEKVTL